MEMGNRWERDSFPPEQRKQQTRKYFSKLTSVHTFRKAFLKPFYRQEAPTALNPDALHSTNLTNIN